MDINGSTILVTGASGGIGRAIAVDLAERGAKVLAVARGEDKLRELADEVAGIRPMPCDVTSAAHRDRLFADAGAIDVVVNNAGSSWIGAFLDMSSEEVADQIALNFTSMTAMCAAALPAMLERNSGHIVNIGSTLGFAPGPPLTVYSATKAAVHAFTVGLRREVVGTNVRVTLIAPGPVKGTAALDQAGDEGVTATVERAFEAIGAEPEDVARAVRRSLETDAKPSNRTITVPRIAGLSRAAAIPGADWAMDHAFGLLRKAGVKLS